MSWKIPTGWREVLASTPAPRLPGIGPRLSAVALAVPEGSVVADIGADHGLLSQALLRAGRARFVHATDASHAALDGARKVLARAVEEGLAAVIHADGFEGTPPGTIDCAILAGTGSATALDIVRRGLAAGHRPKHVVFQPSGGEHDVRVEMLRLGYGLVDEKIVAEGQRLFMVLAFEDGAGVRALDGVTDLYVGPFLKGTSGPLVSAWLEGQADWLGDLLSRAKEPHERIELEERLTSIMDLRRSCDPAG